MKNRIFLLILLLVSGFQLSAQVSLQYKCADTNNTTTQIKPHIIVENTGSTAITLSDLLVRYYYTKEGTASEQFTIDYAVIGSTNITGTFTDGYVEIGFTPGAGTLSAGENTGEIQIRINKSDWSSYDQTDDYSFGPAVLTFTTVDTITIYENGVLVYGTPPVPDATPDPTQTPTQESTPTVTPQMSCQPYANSIYGYVRDANTSTGIEGATIIANATFGTSSTTSGADGSYTLPIYACMMGEYTDYTVSAPGYATLTTGASANGELDFNLVPVSGGEYVLHVKAEWMDEIAATIGYSGDYSGQAATPFDIGPFSSPFTVTLELQDPTLWALGAELRFDCWDYICPDTSTTTTITVNETNPAVTIRAFYYNVEPTQPPPTVPPTPTPTYPVICDGGDVWLAPANRTVNTNESFSWEIHANTCEQLLAAYGFNLSWPPAYLSMNTAVGTNGVEAGSDGFIAAVNPDNEQGTCTISGFDVQGTGPGLDLHVLTVHFIAGDEMVTISVALGVDTLVDPSPNVIGMPVGIGGTLTIVTGTPGDVNGDGVVDIVDALLIAQYYVGLFPENFNPGPADANCDGAVDIVDALIVAQFYVGLIPDFC